MGEGATETDLGEKQNRNATEGSQTRGEGERDEKTAAIGCSSDDWGADFAARYLRKGAQIVTTTESVRPKCKVATSGGGCSSYDGVDFASSPSPSATSLDGPFWSASDFHAGRFWSAIASKL
jgi:hypothetical protein